MSKLYRTAREIQSRLHTQGTQLIKACEAGVLPVVRTIIPKLYPPNSQPIWGVPHPDRLLAIAVKHNHVPILEYLLASLPRPQKQTPWDPSMFYQRNAVKSFRKVHANNELVWAAVTSGSPNVFKVLWDAGINVEDLDDYAQQPIDQAVDLGDLAMTKYLLDKNADPNGRDIISYRTTLGNAVMKLNQDIVLALIEHGARIETSGALMLAAKVGHIEIARLLLRKGADVNEICDLSFVGDDGEYDYDWHERGKGAAEDEMAEDEPTKEETAKEETVEEEMTAEEAAEKGRDPIMATTALHVAARYGQIDMVKFLLENGASKHMCDWRSDLPVHKAKEWGHVEAAKLLNCSPDQPAKGHASKLRRQIWGF